MSKLHSLREYQQDHVNELFSSKHNQNIIQSPTGTGKSVEIAHVTLKLLDSGIKKIMIITPNRELVQNLKSYLGTAASMAFSGMVPNIGVPILITTYKSAHKYLDVFKPEYFISDEAHSVRAETWEKLIPAGAYHLGYTATPSRGDGKPLSTMFKHLITSPSINWFVNHGYLSPYQIIPRDIPEWKLTGRGDDLGQQEKIFGGVPQIKKTVKLWIDECSENKTLIFCTTIDHGILLEKEFMRKGVDARFLSSKTPILERDKHYESFKNGHLKVLINVNLFKTGIDIPDCDCIFACRFFGSEVDAFQSFGRGMRHQDGKLFRYYDLSGTAYYHGDFGLKDDWSLDYTPYKESSNLCSVYHRCVKCDKELIHKSFIEQVTTLTCSYCQQVNVLTPKVRLGDEGKVIFEESFRKFKFKPQYGALVSHMISIERSTKKSKWQKIEELLTLEIPDEPEIEKLKYDIFMRLQIPGAAAKSFMGL